MPRTRINNPFLPGEQIGAGLNSIAQAMFSRPSPLQLEALERKNFATMADAAASEQRAQALAQQGRLYGAQADGQVASNQFIGTLRANEGLDLNAADIAGLDLTTRDSWTPDQDAAFRRARGSTRTGVADGTVDPSQIAASFRTLNRAGFEGDVFTGRIDPARGAAIGNATSASPAPLVRVDGDMFLPTFGTEGMPTDVVRRMFGPTPLGGARIQTEGAKQGTERARTGLYGAQTRTEGARQAELGSRTNLNNTRNAAEALTDITTTDAAGNPATVRARVVDVGREAAQRQFTERTRPDGSQPTTASNRPRGPGGRPRLHQNEIDQMADTILALTGATGSMPLQPDARAAIEAEATQLILSGPPGIQGNVAAATETAIRNLFPGENAFTTQGNWNPFVSNQTVPTRPAVRGAATPVPVPETPVPVPTIPPAGGAPASIPPAGQRVPGQTYSTPRGPMKWNGSGWVPPDA
jgi:hypothetical protein